MISFDFEYYKPSSIEEAVKTFEDLNLEGKEPFYYGGGTEIITFARRKHIFTRAVIDIKGIPECNILQTQNSHLIIGAALTLTCLSETNLFPLLTKAARGIADHTARNKITLGGNICGKIIYKEALLPFLLADSLAVIAGKSGLRYIPINHAFSGSLQLEKEEFLTQIITDTDYTVLPFRSIKKTKTGKTGYPLVTVSSLKKDGWIRTAFSGVYNYPFRSLRMEEYLNTRGVPLEERVDNAIRSLSSPIVDNIQGSAEYRIYVLRNTLLNICEELEGA